MGRGVLMALDAGGGGGHCLLVEPESGRFTRTFRAWSHPAAPGAGGMGSDLDLDAIWGGLGAAAREAMDRARIAPDQVLAVAATSMRHSTVVLDARGEALLAAPNRDSRAIAEGYQLAAACGEELYARAGHWPSPVCTLARLRWLAGCDPAVWQRAAVVLSLSDWVTYRLCGEVASEPSQAGETLLLDLHTRDWAWDMVDELRIPRRILPALRASGTRIGSLTAEAAAALGLRGGTPVAVGGADTQCGLLGAGASAVGAVAAIAGTTVPLQLVLDRPLVDPRQRLWTGCHVLPGLWVLESNAGTMGEALDWFAHMLFPDAPHPVARFLAEAGRSEPGAHGTLSTLGADVMNARQLTLPTGSLTVSHLSTANDPDRHCHLVRGVVEGLAYALRANLDQLRDVSATPLAALSLAGGMSRSEVFAQIVSDTLGLPVTVGATGEATALGAALCAGVCAGLYEDLAGASRQFPGAMRTYQPDPQHARVYEEGYAGWTQLRAARAAADAIAAQIILPSVLSGMTRAAAARTKLFRPRILVTADFDEEGLARLRDLGEVEHASFRKMMRLLTGPALVEALQGVHVFVTEVDVLDAHCLRQLPGLRVVAACRGEAVNVDVAACSAFGVPVLHAPGRNAESVADLTLAFLLMLARKLPGATSFLRQPGIEAGDMGRMGQAFTMLQGGELWRKTVGLVGLGAVGRAVTRRLVACGARVLAYDPHLAPEDVLLADAEPVSLDELLEESDFVSLHAAATEETRGLIGAAQLARMKRGTCLLNTARAALVDEDALAEALRSGHLAGAALDVFAVEPPGSDHPLLGLEQVIATPHVGGNTIDVAAHQAAIIGDDLRRLLCGETPRHALNPEVLVGFDWNQPRREPAAAVLETLAARPAPAVSDIQRPRAAAAVRPRTQAATPEPAAAAGVPTEMRNRMERVLRAFVGRLAQDGALRAFAVGKDVTLHFTLGDLGLALYFRLRNGVVSADLGEPEAPADVELKMRAEIFDGMFTGRVNGMQAATSGQLSFSGDTVKAMTLQHIQSDLSRLYQEARAEAGDPGDLASLAGPSVAQGAAAPQPIRAGDIRAELIRIVDELYAAQLITATGGNVSARAPGSANEIWITPGQLFKGDLRPEILVRLDLEGHSLDQDALSPSSERLMHCAVYRVRPDAQAVVHAHAAHATMLANAGLPFLPISTEAAFFGDIPRVPFLMPGSEELAAAVGAAARDSWAVLLRNHGLLVAGRSLRRAADMAEIIERSAEIILGCYAAGKEPSTLPDDIVRTLRQMGELLA